MEMPIYNLPSKILCKVVYVELKVFQISLHAHAFRLDFIDGKLLRYICVFF